MMVIVSRTATRVVLIVDKCEDVSLTTRRSSALVVQGRLELCRLKLSLTWSSVSKTNLVAVGIDSIMKTTLFETI